MFKLVVYLQAMRRVSVILLLLCLPFFVSAQFGARWKRARRAYTFGVGATNFLGDLGGANQIGTNGLKDLELKFTRLAMSAGYRYQLTSMLYVEGNLALGWVRGDDNTTTEPARMVRNLQFKSHILEGSARFIGYIIREKSGHIYKLKGVRGQSWTSLNLYLFAGIGGFWFNPKGPKDGSWYNLQPLGTEGQGIIPGTKKYSRISMSVPLGFGIGRVLDREWSVNLEVSMHKTFTDYIDDVSGNYYNNAAIKAKYGDMAAYFADPTLPQNLPLGYSMPGQQRGDPTDKDAYMFIMVKVIKKIYKKKRFRPKF